MITRIVKMEFQEAFITEFLENFEKSKGKIRGFKGCSYLALYRDEDHPQRFFTYSFWENDACLQAYRNSDTFKEIWSKTKPGFSNKPEAWSLNTICSLP